MFTRLLTAAALATLMFTPVAAFAHDVGPDGAPDRGAAVTACIDFNQRGPVTLVDVVDDGLGDYLVWVKDLKGDLWACNASGYGDVYASIRMDGDMLGGKGLDLITLVSDTGWNSPSVTAENVCTAMAKNDAVEVLANVADGEHGYLIWLQAENGDITMCNANGRGEVFAFQDVDMPINHPDAGEMS